MITSTRLGLPFSFRVLFPWFLHCLSRVLGGSWVVISGDISPLIWVISIVTLLRTLLRATHHKYSLSGDLLLQSGCILSCP